MKESKKKFVFPKDAFSLGIIISLAVFVIFSLVDTLIYYFSKFEVKFSATMFDFISILLLSAVVLFSVFKGKKLLGSIFFLLTLIIDPGFGFIRNLIYGNVSLSTFNDFYQFLALTILAYLVVIIVLQLKKDRPSLNLGCPQNYLLPLIVVGYSLIFIGFNNTLAIILVFAVLLLLGEANLIGWFVAARFAFGISNIIDFFLWKSEFPNYTESFGFWMNNVLILILFVLGVIAIFKPELFVLKKKAPSPKLEGAEAEKESPAEVKQTAKEAEVIEKEHKEAKTEEKVSESAEKVEESPENIPEE